MMLYFGMWACNGLDEQLKMCWTYGCGSCNKEMKIVLLASRSHTPSTFILSLMWLYPKNTLIMRRERMALSISITISIFSQICFVIQPQKLFCMCTSQFSIFVFVFHCSVLVFNFARSHCQLFLCQRRAKLYSRCFACK